MTPAILLEYLVANNLPVSARSLHKMLEIRQPYALWLHLRVTGISIYRQPDDYCFVQRGGERDCDLSPTTALTAAAGGGSRFAAKLQAIYCRFLSEAVFKGRNVLEVFDTGLKCAAAEELLTRSFDPEQDANS